MATWDSSISYSALGSQPAPPKHHPPLSCQAPPLLNQQTLQHPMPLFMQSPPSILFFFHSAKLKTVF